MSKFDKNIRIICGTNDKIFPPAEIRATLARHNIAVVVEEIKGVPTPHLQHDTAKNYWGQRWIRQKRKYRAANNLALNH